MESKNTVVINDDEQPSTSKGHPSGSFLSKTANVAPRQKEDVDIEDDELAKLVSAEEFLINDDVVFLDYEKQMFLDIVQTDGLIVCAKGLSYDRVLTSILKIYSDAANLVLIMNCSDWEEQYYKSKLESKYVHEVANNATERERVYILGGVQFISTRILVVDLLKNRVPIELITGIVVMRAHTIIESCQEAFALRLYRQRNKTGFIKAFSSSPEAFTIGYSHIERTMRNLFVKELYIWPRFHAVVQGSLKPYEAESIEIHVPMTEKMKLIQANILDVMNYLVREIKRINRNVDMEEITVENCVTKKFHKILQAQLDDIWHQLNSQTKLIVADLKILRNLMIAMMYNDAVSAYALTKRYRTTEYVLSNSGWTLLDAAEQIFKYSKERVYNTKGEFEPEPCPKWRFLTEILRVEVPQQMKVSRPNSDEAPKVLILCQDTRTCYQLKQYLTQSGAQYLLLSAMRHEVPIGKLSKSYEKLKSKEEWDATFTQALSQAQSKTDIGSQSTTKSSQKSSKSQLSETASNEEEFPKEVDELTQLLQGAAEEDLLVEECYQEHYMLTMTQTQLKRTDLLDSKDDVISLLDDESEEKDTLTTNGEDESIFEPFPELDQLDITAAIAENKQPLICIQTFKTEREGSMSLIRMLDEMNPHYVVMYHCNLTAIRQLEIYEARKMRPRKDRTKVFFLIHARTVEEQSYLTSLRREKQAFELIIETRRTMVIPEYQDGKTDEAFILYKPHADVDSVEAANAASRKAGGQVDAEQEAEKSAPPRIIVDMREFRSDLPCLIHRRGIEVVPVTITIGDYILTPEICVERKSVSDLIGSLNSGRLYNQCIQMQRFYARPILLIEFDQNKPFHLQSKYMLSQNTTSTNTDILQKLQLLTIHFPKLRLIWSPSPYATAQLFEELKLQKDEPDPKKAAAIGAEDASGEFDEGKFNANIYDFLVRLPGVNTKNINKLMRHGGSLKELLKKSMSELSELLDSQENGKMLYDILHVRHLPEKDDVKGSTAMLAAGKQYGAHSRFRRGASSAMRRGRGRFKQ